MKPLPLWASVSLSDLTRALSPHLRGETHVHPQCRLGTRRSTEEPRGRARRLTAPLRSPLHAPSQARPTPASRLGLWSLTSAGGAPKRGSPPCPSRNRYPPGHNAKARAEVSPCQASKVSGPRRWATLCGMAPQRGGGDLALLTHLTPQAPPPARTHLLLRGRTLTATRTFAISRPPPKLGKPAQPQHHQPQLSRSPGPATPPRAAPTRPVTPPCGPARGPAPARAQAGRGGACKLPPILSPVGD